MKNAWLTIRSADSVGCSAEFILQWSASFVLLLGIVVDPRKNDWLQRAFFRNILRLAGVKFEVRRAPGL